MIDIPEGWEEKKLLKIGKIVSGTTPNTDIQEFWGNDYIWLTPNDLKNDNNLNLISSQRMISEKGMKTFFSNAIPKDSLIISTRAPIGYVGIVRDEYSTNQGCKSLICFDSQCVDYHYYNIKDNVKKLRLLSTGTTFEEISKKDLENTSFIIPKDKKEQEKIAEILSEVDSAIDKAEAYYEKNRKIKTALMQDLLTHGIDEKGKIRNPKTHQYKSSPLGDIPMEWDCVELGQYCDVRDGTHDSPKYVKNGIPFITSKNLTDYGIDFENITYISKEDHKFISQRSKVENGDILFGMIGTIGKPTLVNSPFEFSIKNVALIKKIAKNFNNKYLLHYLKSNYFEKNILNIFNGGVQNFISLGMVRQLKILKPDKTEQREVSKILSSQDEKIEKAKVKLEKLKSLKTALMQDLLSGTKRVNHLLGVEL